MSEIRFNSILTPPVGSSRTVSSKQAENNTKTSFSSILNDALNDAQPIKFSKHAQIRLESRNIGLEKSDIEKLEGAVDAASQKGVQDSLVLMNGLAFIVSVPDRTVVTAMPVSEASSSVFTNIDGAVIA
jgi:flagellar operon protein